MPQLTLTFSANINTDEINFNNLFQKIHEVLLTVPNMDISTVHSGVIQELFSYIGLDHPQATKVYLELYWLENEERALMKPELGRLLLDILEKYVVPKVEALGLLCIPRVRIAHLGILNQSYFISGISPNSAE
jgi:5-carboxymethyl-2-hydroxymuconate isomerase